MSKIRKEELKDKSILIVCAYISLGGIGKILKFVANNFCDYLISLENIYTKDSIIEISDERFI